MSDEFEDMTNHENRGFEEDGATEPQFDRPRADRINRKRLEGLAAGGKFLQIFYRDPKTGALVKCKDLANIRLEVAGICSDLIDKTVIMKRDTLFVLPDTFGKEAIPMIAYKYVLDWIRKCGEELKEVGIKDDHPIPEPNTDDFTADAFTPLIDIIRAAEKLKIPHDSFTKFVLKQMLPLSRKYLIPLTLVEKIYDHNSILSQYPDLQEIAWSSIYEAWYMYKLEGVEFDDYMEALTDLRNKIEQLDVDLHAASEKKDQFLKAARERRRNRDAENVGGSDFGGSGSNEFTSFEDKENGGTNGNGFGGQDWTQDNGGHDENTDWTNNGGDSGDGNGNNWADEMNEDYHHNSAFEAVPAVPVGGW